MRRMISLLLALLLMISAGGLTAFADNVSDCIGNLNLFMSRPENVTIDLDQLAQDFGAQGSIGYGRQFKMYTQIMQMVERGDFEQAQKYLRALKLSTDFGEYISSESFKKYLYDNGIISIGEPAIRPLEELEHYINGRRAEASYDAATAFAEYSLCVNCYDAFDRYTNLAVANGEQVNEVLLGNAMDCFLNGEYDKALKLIEPLVLAGDEDAIALYDVILLEKDPATKAPAATPMPRITPVPEATAVPATQAPVAQAPATKSSSWSWSAWQDSYPYGVSADQVESKTQYRFRDAVTQYRYRTQAVRTTVNEELSGMTASSLSKEYGDWSAWSDTAVTATENREVQTQTVDVKETVTTWSYSRYEYEHAKHIGMLWHSCIDTSNQSYFVQGYGWKTESSTTRYTNMGVVNGCTQYKSPAGKSWYNEKSSTTEKVTGTKTQYRYRDVDIIRTYRVWGAWSSWSTSPVAEATGREVQTQSSYGSWSSWQDGAVSETGSRDVETRKVYRYKIWK